MGNAFAIPLELVDEIRSKALHAAKPRSLTPKQRDSLFEKIKILLKKRNAVLITHYYVDEQLQILTDATGGYIGDSLGMADYGNCHPATTLVVVGVRFMGESAKILNPEKTVLMPDMGAGCSLASSITGADVRDLRAAHPGRPVVTYVNTSVWLATNPDRYSSGIMITSSTPSSNASSKAISWPGIR